MLYYYLYTDHNYYFKMIIPAIIVVCILIYLMYYYKQYTAYQEAIKSTVFIEGSVDEVKKLATTASSGRKNAIATNNIEVSRKATEQAVNAANKALLLKSECESLIIKLDPYDELELRAKFALESIKKYTESAVGDSREAQDYLNNLVIV